MFATKLVGTSLDSIFLIESVFDCLARLDGKSLVLVDRCGKLVVSSSCAATIFDEGSYLKLERGYVLASKKSDDDRLKGLLLVRGGVVETIVLRSDSAKRHMVLRACAFDEALVCLSVTNAESTEGPVLPDLESLFGLTPSEARIVRALYEGRTPQWIAEDHRNSIHTIRAHIRHCYDKLGVSCREELWSKLNVYRIR